MRWLRTESVNDVNRQTKAGSRKEGREGEADTGRAVGVVNRKERKEENSGEKTTLKKAPVSDKASVNKRREIHSESTRVNSYAMMKTE